MSRGLRIALAAGGLLMIAQIVLLTIQLGVLRKSYSHIRAQDAKQAELYPLQKTIARNALPLLRDARHVVRPLGRQTRQIARATNTLPDLVSQGVPALRGVRELVGAIFSRDMIGTIARTAADVHASRGMLEESLAIQRQALVALQQSVAIQQETLQHARSIDNKTGGPLPAP